MLPSLGQGQWLPEIAPVSPINRNAQHPCPADLPLGYSPIIHVCALILASFSFTLTYRSGDLESLPELPVTGTYQ